MMMTAAAAVENKEEMGRLWQVLKSGLVGAGAAAMEPGS
jgi:hypothetical protein